MLAALSLLLGLSLAAPPGARPIPADAGLPPVPALRAEARPYLAWQRRLGRVAHPEPAYHFLADVHAEIAPLVEAMPERITPFRVGGSLEGRPIWGFRVREHTAPVQRRLLVFANIHALEWITTEIAVAFLRDLATHPPPGVEVVVIPVLNPDGRAKVEADLLAGANRYRRGNAPNVDLNRDFAVNREARAAWARVIPRRYETTDAPLSQPESQALDALLAEEPFDVAVSLHAYGGWFFYPWAGDWARPADRPTFERLGRVMAEGQGARAYNPKQLGRWAFFFRGHGMEIDHMYGQYGTLAFLWECTRGRDYLRFQDYGVKFRIYNPPDPTEAVRRDHGALQALVGALSWEARGLMAVAEDERAVRRSPARPVP
jgi:hypothetical protein